MNKLKKRNIKLLERAARELVAQNKKMDMKHFRSEGGVRIKQHINAIACGSAGCFLGWCPFLGIKELELIDDDKNESGINFLRYGKRVFDIYYGDIEWSFFFAASWPACTEQCLARVLHYKHFRHKSHWYYCNYTTRYDHKTGALK